jgi:hypothetical protein
VDWDDLKVFLGTAVLIIGLTVGFAYVNVYISEKNDRQTMKEISSSKVVGKYSYIEKTPEQIMPVTAVNTDGILFQNTQYIPESTQIKYKVVLENGKELNVSQDIWNKTEIQKKNFQEIEKKKAENFQNKETRKIEFVK